MLRNFKFEPQEAISVIVESIVSACLCASGVSIEQATTAGTFLGAVTRGISVSDNGTANSILSSLEKAVAEVLNDNTFDMPNDCGELLRNDVLSPRKIVKFMCQPNSDKIIKECVMRIFEKIPDCDPRTFHVDDFVLKIIESFEDEVLNNHELATYATYCMQCRTTASSTIHIANEKYVDSFKEPLFLHKEEGNSRVCLKNLFVLQKYQFLTHNNIDWENSEDFDEDKGLQDAISYCLNEAKLPFLFIEGDAGSGKTTLIAWMNYQFRKINARKVSL